MISSLVVGFWLIGRERQIQQEEEFFAIEVMDEEMNIEGFAQEGRPEQIFESGMDGVGEAEAVDLVPTIEERIDGFYELASFLSDGVLTRLQDAILDLFGQIDIDTDGVMMAVNYSVDIETRILTFALYDDRGDLIGEVSLKVEHGASIRDVKFIRPDGSLMAVPY